MFFRLIQYLSYFFTSKHKKGHGIHSPFLYEFITKVLNDKTIYDEYKTINDAVKSLKKNKHIVEVSMFGAKMNQKSKKRISQITTKSSIRPKYGQLLFRIVRYYKLQNILELGTCFGISTLYLAKANSSSRVTTVEGCTAYCNVARQLFYQTGTKNVHIINEKFDNVLPNLLLMNNYDFIFIDGNHSYEATIKYFQSIVAENLENTIVVIDDIYWSPQMKKAWIEIIHHPKVTLSVDLFQLGIVFLNPNIFGKLHYRIRF
ncbi:MAG: class I SAM-dependent methyltransferase [Bacteroidales bacterium]|nr:class I SAM-dependent methyltransferase [Bacteroidales bacterium]